MNAPDDMHTSLKLEILKTARDLSLASIKTRKDEVGDEEAVATFERVFGAVTKRARSLKRRNSTKPIVIVMNAADPDVKAEKRRAG